MSGPDFDPDLPGGLPPEWTRMFRDLFGDHADEAIAQLQASGFDLDKLAENAGIGTDPATLSLIAQQIRGLFASSGERGINWPLARDLARQVSAQGGDPSVGEADRRAIVEARTAADLWLDAATSFPPTPAAASAWSRAEWVESTMPAWQTLAEPVAASMADALADALTSQLPEGEQDFTDHIIPMMRQLGGTVFCMQLGQAVGQLSREVFGATDVGLPLLREPSFALVPENIKTFAEGLDAPMDEVRLFLALREAAHARLFTHVGWLRGHLFGAVEAYARGLSIDTDQLEEAIRSVDPTDAEALQAAMSGGVFALETTPEQRAALTRLETALALVEGWVDEVVAAAANGRLPHTEALREMIRRRRASGGPAEHTLATLVGLKLRPRRARDAAALFAGVELAQGIEGRENLWAHPDVLPTADDLDEPGAYLARREAAQIADAEMDAALAELLDGTTVSGPDDAAAAGPDGPMNPSAGDEPDDGSATGGQGSDGS